MHRIAQGSLSLLRSRATRRRRWRSAVRTRPEYVPLSIDFGRRAALSVYISCVSAEMLFTMRIISEGVFESGAHYFGRNIGHVLILSLAFYAASFTQRAAASSIDELRRSRYLSSILGGQYLSQAMHHSEASPALDVGDGSALSAFIDDSVCRALRRDLTKLQ